MNGGFKECKRAKGHRKPNIPITTQAGLDTALEDGWKEASTRPEIIHNVMHALIATNKNPKTGTCTYTAHSLNN